MCPILPIFTPKKALNKIDFKKKFADCQKMIIFFKKMISDYSKKSSTFATNF